MNRLNSKTFFKCWIFSLAAYYLVILGCATTKTPPVDPLAYKNRTKTSVKESVTVTVAVPTIAEAQAHTIRFWHTPIRYQGKPVWIAQTSVRLGGRFAEEGPTGSTLPLDPDVDEARIDLTQDLAYSQALIKIGHVKGAGGPQTIPAETPHRQLQYTTDGLRVVLVFGDRPAGLDTIDFFNWEPLVDYRE